MMITVDEARSYYSGKDAAHDFEHVLRVLRLAERIGQVEGADMAILRAAVLLHDIARSDEESGGPCHAQQGAQRAREILALHPCQRVEAVATAIATHRFRSSEPPVTLEAKVLYDADKLDAIGAIGIARAFAVAGRHGQRLWAEVQPGLAQRDVDQARGDLANDRHTPVHEYVFKLSRLRDALFTETGRKIAADRHAYMVQFFRRLEQEVAGEL